MYRWLLVIFVVLMVANHVTPYLRKLGVGRLPGDIRFTLFGKEIFLPFASTVLLSLLAAVIAKVV
jgi:hypothetical protein